ncbi:hypothetical protein NC651_038929 [Populus alba x Populus x berolinensis]|nr:hypothetical protein NC651_038929 [Populus alba x Populus x berolinensis]
MYIYIFTSLSLSLTLSLSETVCKGAVMISSLCKNQAGRGTPFRWHDLNLSSELAPTLLFDKYEEEFGGKFRSFD